LKTEIGKKTEKSKTVEQRKSMNSQVVREISPEGISGLWRVGFMEKKGFEVRMKKCRGDGRREWYRKWQNSFNCIFWQIKATGHFIDRF